MLIDEYFKNLPDYYDTMYLDGYTPDQIMEAQHRSMRKRWEAEQQHRREEAATEKAMPGAATDWGSSWLFSLWWE